MPQIFHSVSSDFYVVAILCFLLVLGMQCLKGRKSICVWWLSNICAIIGLIAFIRLGKYNELGLVVGLLTQCIIYPFVSHNNVCTKCGKRLYWKSLFSRKCFNCNEIQRRANDR
jgi:hypothetical protein